MFSEGEYDTPRQSTSLKEITGRTGYKFIHGTMSGMVTSMGKPSPDEYRHRPPPPISWEDKMKLCLDKHPPLSVGRVVAGNQRTARELWSPVGLILSDGEIVGTSGHITGPNGKMERFGGGESFPYPPDINHSDFNKGPYSVYEVGVIHPTFSAVYVCPEALEHLGDGTDYVNIEARASKIAVDHNLPLAFIDKNGGITYRNQFNFTNDEIENEHKIRQKDPGVYFEAEQFPLGTLVRQKILTADELKSTVLKLPFKRMPDVRFLSQSKNLPEFVDLERIVGAATGKDWLIYDGNDSRDPNYILKLLNGLVDGSINLLGEENYHQPINIAKFKNEFYVFGDGRHRVAILKALKVPFAPMLVTHITN